MLRTAFGQMLPEAIGVAVSPLPIVAVVLVLVTPGGRGNGAAFVLGWIAGLAVAGTIVLAVAGGAGAGTGGGQPAAWARVLHVVVGVLMLALAAGQWRRRPRGEEEPATPKWMGALDAFGPGKALGAGVLLSALNPKNLLLTVGGAAAIAQRGAAAGQQALAYAVFVLLATLGVGAPVVLALVLGDRSRPLLDGLKGWMAAHNTAILAVLLLVMGVKQIGTGIA